ncbi:MAG: hypothetical protein LKF36_10415 [Lactobacillus sp.]|jgi:hypothetical protein|nr:hypothetical protein [Lactobacillus sp.]
MHVSKQDLQAANDRFFAESKNPTLLTPEIVIDFRKLFKKFYPSTFPFRKYSNETIRLNVLSGKEILALHDTETISPDNFSFVDTDESPLEVDKFYMFDEDDLTDIIKITYLRDLQRFLRIYQTQVIALTPMAKRIALSQSVFSMGNSNYFELHKFMLSVQYIEYLTSLYEEENNSRN